MIPSLSMPISSPFPCVSKLKADSSPKAPLGVSLVAKNCVVSGVPRYWPMSTYFLLFAL